MENKELGIYIHIPFCKQKCYYCDFVSFSNKQNQIEKYIETVKKEITQYFENKNILEKYTITTIYIGGGTPSYIYSSYIVEILNLLKKYLKNNKIEFEDIEITIEVNPGTVDKEKLEQYKKAKINRLSIGLQSTNNNILREIGRIHTFEQFLETYNNARKVGFKNINIDLMIGLPEQKIQDIKESLEEILKLNPEHISVYSLIIEEGTIIAQKIQNKQIEEIDEETERNMYWYVKNLLELNDYKHYEISNFAKKGKQSKHNMNCWQQKEYIGIGLSAHSYLNYMRYSNTSKIDQYINKINKLNGKIIDDILNIDKNPKKENIEIVYDIEEIQNIEDRKKEYMLLGLRKIEGVKISEFKTKYIDNPIFLYRKQLEKLVNDKLLIIDGDNIKLTNKGLDLANLVWEEFI